MDLTPTDNQAIYIASVTPSYAQFVHAGDPKRPVPDGLSLDELNFLNPSSQLFHVTHCMSSAGQAMNQGRPCFITERDRSKTVVIGDSGGFQIIGGNLNWEGDRTREQILRWLEKNVDWAMTLDVPTRATQNWKKSGYKTFEQCLSATLANLEYFQKHRNPDAPTKFLNVLQGENMAKATEWYQAVKGFEFEGWAFAGVHRLNLKNLCERIIDMADDNLIQDRDWIHILGTNRITQDIGFTALQRAINDTGLNPRLRISFDTSSPFQLAGAHRTVYSMPGFSHDRAVLQSSPAPNSIKYVGASQRFPWPSPIGDRITCGDICVRDGNFLDTRWDELSLAMLINHNYASLLMAIQQAHRIVDMEVDIASRCLPSFLREQMDVVHHVIKSGSKDQLKKYSSILTHYAVRKETPDSILNGEASPELAAA